MLILHAESGLFHTELGVSFAEMVLVHSEIGFLLASRRIGAKEGKKYFLFFVWVICEL